MQTALAEPLRGTPEGREAEAVLRKCVHCGFCLPACPTYRLLGDERDSPRGRIYLMKAVLEGAEPTATTQLHLDRCLTCRACETACPSGVEYHKLLDVGRAEVEKRVPRDARAAFERRVLSELFTRRRAFGLLVALGRLFRWLLPGWLRRQLGDGRKNPSPYPLPQGEGNKKRKMLMLAGCVQPALRPNTNAAAARVLARAGVTLVEAEGAGCCGALRFHNGDQDGARADMRRLVDAWWPHVEAGVSAIVITASGCGAHLRDIGRLLSGDAAYRDKAARVAALIRDLSEVVEAEAKALPMPAAAQRFTKVAFQSPCTLQHGQQLRGGVELLLKSAGYELVPVTDGQLCCGSAGTYSIFQPELANRLRENKVAALLAGKPDVIATANVGCQTHLAAATEVPVRHWIELLDEVLAS